MTISNTYKWLNIEKARFYTIAVRQDNKTQIVIYHQWGGCNSNRGGNKNLPVQNEEEAQRYIQKMLKRRKSRGYSLVHPSNH